MPEPLVRRAVGRHRPARPAPTGTPSRSSRATLSRSENCWVVTVSPSSPGSTMKTPTPVGRLGRHQEQVRVRPRRSVVFTRHKSAPSPGGGIVKLLTWCGAARIGGLWRLRRRGLRYAIEVIGHAVWLYHRFTLSLRDVEELMLARGVVVTYKSIRSWCAKFGPDYAAQLRRSTPPQRQWHLRGFREHQRHPLIICRAPRPPSAATCSTSSCGHAVTQWRLNGFRSCSRACATCARAGDQQAGQLSGRSPRRSVR